MTEHVAHDLGVHPFAEEQGRGSVAQVVETDLRKGQSLQQGMEVPLDQVLAAQRPADMVREDQVVVLPQVAGVSRSAFCRSRCPWIAVTAIGERTT